MNVYAYVVPLALAISLVYSASRHERWDLILRHAARICVTILGVMLIATSILLLINTRV